MDSSSDSSSEDGHRELKKFVLFCNSDGEAMHFLVQVRDKVEEERVCQVIREHVGGATNSRSEFGNHTAVLVDDNALSWGHNGDVFKVSYIEECIKKGFILNISKFLKDRSNEFVENFDFMNVVYFRNYSWDMVPHKYRLNNKNRNSDDDSIDQDFKCAPIRRRGEPYSRKEKEAILKYVLKNFAVNGNCTLKGNKLWRNMEEANVCPARTWQSMKEHFIKYLVKELSSYSFVSQKERTKIQNSIQIHRK